MRRVWGNGNVYLGSVEQASARYIAGYITDKLTDPTDDRLEGRHPEFARMSRMPGIGYAALPEIASQVLEYEDRMGNDVPHVLQHGGANWPLGTYLRRKLRLHVGRDEKAPEAAIQEAEERMRPLREFSDAIAPPNQKRETFRNQIIEAGHGKRLRLEYKLRQNRRIPAWRPPHET